MYVCMYTRSMHRKKQFQLHIGASVEVVYRKNMTQIVNLIFTNCCGGNVDYDAVEQRLFGQRLPLWCKELALASLGFSVAEMSRRRSKRRRICCARV